MADERMLNAGSADQLREARGETGLPGPAEGADIAADTEPGIGPGPTTVPGNMDQRRPLGDDEVGETTGQAGAALEDQRASYPAAGLDTDEAQDETPA